MATPGFRKAIEDYHAALGQFPKGDPKPLLALYAQGPDDVIANPFGPPARGWSRVGPTIEQAATHYRGGESLGFETIVAGESAELAYLVEIERYRTHLAGQPTVTTLALRVTTVFRRHGDAWKIVHRHADTITAPRSVDALAADATGAISEGRPSA